MKKLLTILVVLFLVPVLFAQTKTDAERIDSMVNNYRMNIGKPLPLDTFKQEAIQTKKDTIIINKISNDPITLKSLSRIGFFFTDNQYVYGLNTFMLFSKSKVYDAGFGSGIEFLERGNGFVSTTQIPLIFKSNFYFQLEGVNTAYFTFEAGYNLTIKGAYIDDVTTSTSKSVNLTDDQLKGGGFYTLGFGHTFMSDLVNVELLFRNQVPGITYPVNDRYFMIGLTIGFRL